MRTIDATLTAALAAGSGRPFLKGFIGYTDGSVLHSANITRYKLTGSTLEFEMPYSADAGGDQTAIWLQRGLTIAGVDYTLTTGRFRLLSQHYLPNGHQVAQGALFPKQYYSAAGDGTYQQVITDFCTAFGKTAVFRDPAAAWLPYQFLPTGKQIILNDANRFANMLAAKYLIFLCDNGSEEVLVYSCAGSLAVLPDITLAPVNDFYRDHSARSNRCLLWRDDAGTVHTAGNATDPLHNLGYLPTGASAPTLHAAPNLFQAITRPDLRVLDGDVVQVAAFGGTVNGYALVSEEYAAPDKGHAHPRWETIITSNEVFHNTEGGAVPSTIERVSNFTPLNTGMFNGLLSSADNNLQAAMDTIDDLALSKYSCYWAATGLLQTVPQAATRYMAPFMDGLNTAAITTNFPRAATLKNLYVRTTSPQPAGGSLVINVLSGGAATGITITIPAGQAGGTFSDTTHTYALTAGYGISFSLQNNAPAAASAQINGIVIELAGLT